MRIVLDKNVLARAAMRTSGLGRELLLRCTVNPHALVLSEAIAGQAAVLCSRDRHLHQPEVVTYCRAHGVEVMNDVELMRRLCQPGEGSEDR